MSIKFYGAKFTNCTTALSICSQMEIKCNQCGHKEILNKGEHNFNQVYCPQCGSDLVTISSVDDGEGGER